MRVLVCPWRLGGLMLMILVLGGCSLVSVDRRVRYSDAEGYFDPRLLEQIEPGQTTRDWLHAHFGEPLFLDEGLEDPTAAGRQIEIATWGFVRQQQKNPRVFLLFRSRNLQEAAEYLHVVLEEGLVVKVWRDQLETVDTRRVISTLGYQPRSLQGGRTEEVPAAVAPPVGLPSGPSTPPPAEAGVVPPADPVVTEDIFAPSTPRPSRPVSGPPQADRKL